MHRRQFLKTGVALSAVSLPFWALGADRGISNLKHLGKPKPFDYAALKGQARTLASSGYQAPPSTLPRAISDLNWDQWQAIRFKEDHSLWHGDDLRFQARFFHLGFTIKTPVRMFEIADGQAQELAYDTAMFDYKRAGVNSKSLPETLGFAGFRLNFHTDWVRDIAAFQGASYFRAVSGSLQYGQSARGLAVNTGMIDPEEFPNFVAYYLERPDPNSSRITVYGLLDSPSVTGAYRFIMDVADTLVMDIDAALYPRQPIERIGIAPCTSMYQHGENDRRMGDDWRPEIHDTDGLQIWTGSGERLWRPLVNPQVPRLNAYFDDNPRGFGLIQRDRNFDHYQDDGVFYEKRPSLWVEPKHGWGKGAVMLFELPTPDETFDNINAFWNPEKKPQPGEELLFGYKLHWCRQVPIAQPLATVRATRTGIGGVIGQPRKYFSKRFAVDFAGGDFSRLGSDAKVEAVISASRGRIEITSARPLHAIDGWRAMFDLVPDASEEPIDLRLFLRVDGQPLTETWIYQYTPPPLEQRSHG